MAITEAELRLIDRVWTEAFERGDLDVIDDGLRSDYVLHTPGATEPIRGAGAFREYVRQYNEGFPDLSVTIEDRLVADDAVTERVRMQGTHRGEFRDVPPTGEEIDVTAILVHYVEGGAVAETHSEFDTFELLQQLGVVEDPR